MAYRIGVDVGGTSIKAGVIDDELRITARASAHTESGFENVVKTIADTAAAAAAKLGMRLEDFPSVGIGTPGCIDPATGTMLFSGNVNWKNVPLRQELEKHIPVPVYLGNDANCAILGETAAGAAKGRSSVVMLTLGTGVGGGVILNGKLFTGGDGLGAELGHVPLISGGVPCTCGMRGCLEAYVSVTALIRQTREAMEKHPESAMHRWYADHGRVSGRTAFECARKGDKAALEVIDAYEDHLAAGIGGFINVFRPEIVLLGGGLSNEGDGLLRPLREKVPAHVFASGVMGCPPIERATLGNDAGIIGAACLDRM